MEKLTKLEREEIEILSHKLFGETSAWQKLVKNGIIEPLKDEEGKQIFHKNIPVFRKFYKTERQVLEQFRNLIALNKTKTEELERQYQEEEIKKQILKCSGKTGT